MNHTSDQHPWFQRARRAKPGSRWRNFYVWSDTPDKYKETRIIFKDVEVSNWSWDPVANAYYWHRFFAHQPDLNYDNPEVFEEMLKVLDFWLDLGVDGVRLDAVPYLYEREGTSCENLPETHAALKKLREHVDKKYGDRMLLGEANQWPEDAVAYFGQGTGDECHMTFHFPLMPRLFMAVRMEDRMPIVDILEQTPAIPQTAQWALFLRNHDELTLEMVTDEERDYMYRTYAHVHQGAAEPRHPPSSGAAAGQRPPADRTAQRPALLAARHAGALLRGRNRHGREHFSGRSQRRAHADAVEFGQERGVFARHTRRRCTCRSSTIRSIITKR
jgi:maltose alpha-D-glucosyltransferase / alpha-amylase